ncbi:MAG: ribonuclease H-like domain-containing protein [Clostridia bacterium]|nr:ribonuclease H-like domain-containing protein [Clostridia bacterium]
MVLNLRDKLKAVDNAAGRTAAAKKTFTDCWHKTSLHPLEEFPHAFHLSPETLMLMQGEDMPPDLDPRRILYLDTETTGLSGGAGTVAFEIGLGYLTDEGFVIQQLVMRDYPEERYMLSRTAALLEDFDVICTFNGKSFDIPLLRDRLIMNRMDATVLDLPHIDLLHIARRVFKLRLKRCNLAHLEEAVLGMPRTDDLPGSEAPQRFFSYLKTGAFDLLIPVLEHNEQDVASLCVLLGHMAHMYEAPEEQKHEEDLFSMGVALEKLHHHEEAQRCYRLSSFGKMRSQGQLHLAAACRRCGNKREAVSLWEDMARRKEGGIVPLIELAKYYEHTARDIPKAMTLTRQAMMMLAEPKLAMDDKTVQEQRNAVQYRYKRLKEKLSKLKE